jgi:hypothetical protein
MNYYLKLDEFDSHSIQWLWCTVDVYPINAGPMTMESSFPFTFNFATLNLDNNQSLYF